MESTVAVSTKSHFSIGFWFIPTSMDCSTSICSGHKINASLNLFAIFKRSDSVPLNLNVTICFTMWIALLFIIYLFYYTYAPERPGPFHQMYSHHNPSFCL